MAITGMVAAQVSEDDEECPGCASRIASGGKIYEGEKVAGNVATEGISIEKTAPAEIVKGDVLQVTIYLTNGFSKDYVVKLREDFGRAENVDMGVFESSTSDILSPVSVYYKTFLGVPANSKVKVAYTIKPLYFGKFKIAATELSTEGINLESNPLTVLVRCNQNKICETEEDENSYTCPQDCSPKDKDDLCDMRSDGICDPDCAPGEDLDCTAATTTTAAQTTTTTAAKPFSETCGNGVCGVGENYASCPADCPSGRKDLYCDKVKDGSCDPDCPPGLDPDCSKPNDSGLMILLLVVLVLVAVIAYKKRWLRAGR